MSKRRTLISMGICLVASLLLFCVGVYASKVNVANMTFAVKFDQGVYAKVYVRTSDASLGEDLYYSGSGNFVVDENTLLVADSYTNSESIISSGVSIAGAESDKYGYFNLYVYIENYSNFDIWSDVKVSEGGVDLNSVANLSYQTNDWELIDRKVNTTVDTSLRVITVKVNYKLTKNLTVNVSLHENYEYLQNNRATGQQPYINTGYNLTSNSRVQTEFEILNASQNGFIFGGRTAGNNNNFVLYSSTQFRRDYFTSGVAVGPTLITNHIYNIDFNKNVLNIDGTDYSGSALPSQQSTGYPCWIFANNNTGSLQTEYVRDIKMYSFKIYEKDVLVRDYIPAKNTSNVACMYDKVTKLFYLNANATGTFTIGNNYTQYDYLQSSGTQYIDTGVKLESKYITETKLQTTICSTDQIFLGGRSTGNRIWIDLDNTNLLFGYGIYHRAASSYLTNNTYYDIRAQHIPDNQYINVNGSSLWTNTLSNNYSFNLTNYLFAANDDGAVLGYAKIKLYSCKFIDAETNKIVRDYVPAKVGDSIGLYDRVTHTLFTNAGTGTFTIG